MKSDNHREIAKRKGYSGQESKVGTATVGSADERSDTYVPSQESSYDAHAEPKESSCPNAESEELHELYIPELVEELAEYLNDQHNAYLWKELTNYGKKEYRKKARKVIDIVKKHEGR